MKPSKNIETDLCVIGAGSAGLSVAAGATQMGARVVLIEGDKMGGDCLNYGCVPSKALLAWAKKTHLQSHPYLGNEVDSVPSSQDFVDSKNHLESIIEEIAPHDSQERFEELGATVLRGYARFISKREITVGDTKVRARRFVIATGAKPRVPPIPGLETISFSTNETIFALRDRPEHLLVIGGGPIGLELAQAHRRLGSQVTVIGSALLGNEDPETAQVAIAALREEGIKLLGGVRATECKGSPGAIEVVCSDGQTISGSHLLLAVGRKANIDSLDLDKACVKYSKDGIVVNSRLKTSNRRIYAIGDVLSKMQFTHVAGYQAGVVVRSALLGLPSKERSDHLPWATYTDPEIAQVGLLESKAREKFGKKVQTVRVDYADNDRAKTDNQRIGFLKVMVVKGRPIGASMVGAHAGELIQVWGLAIANKLKMSAVAAMVAPYPSLGEINKRAAGAYFSPMLFENKWIRRLVRLVQKMF